MKKLFSIWVIFLAIGGAYLFAQDNQQIPQQPKSQFFIENKGQWDSQVQYLARLGGLNLWVTNSGVVYDYYKVERNEEFISETGEPNPSGGEIKRMWGHAISSKFIGANEKFSTQVFNKSEGYYNYFLGNDPTKWVSFVPLYSSVQLNNIYNNIDVRYYYDQGMVRYDWVIRAGGDPSKIRIKFEGQDGMYVNAKGDLVLQTSLGEVEHTKILAYQMNNGNQSIVECKFKEEGNGIVTFDLSNYDKSQDLIIDPLVWNVFSTYLGGYTTDYTQAVAADVSGSAYITGYTYSYDFPTTVGAWDQIYNSTDAYVTKLDPTLSSLVYSTFLGGTSGDYGYGIAVDASGSAYITGYTSSSNFPTTVNAWDRIYNSTDAYVTKLNAAGSALVYSTYLGGSSSDYGYGGIEVDGSGCAYVSGYTTSYNFPTTPGCWDNIQNSSDVFVTKLNETGSVLVYSTYVGGTSSDYGYGLAVDGSGCAYITGYTLSSNFPTTIGCWDYIYNSTDVFVTKLNASGSALVYSTYLGGTSSDYGYGGIAVDASGCAYVSGYTSSSNFPTTSGCWDNTYNSYEIFVTKFNPAGSSLVYSTYLGGNSLDYGYGIAVDELGRAIVGGYTYSSDYPVTADAFQRTYSSIDAIFTILKADGTGLEYSTYLGGTSSDYGYYYSCIARGGSNTIIVGYTSSTNFPTTSGAYKTTSNGGYDGFITAFDLEPRTITLGTVSPSQFCPGDEYQNITVSFSLSGTFISGNVFTAQISDQNGSFTNPQTIGILMGTTSGVINCSLPVLEVNKTYFIRIVSSKPSIISDAFGPIIINPLPEKFRVIGSGIYCVNDAKGALIELERSQANTLYQLKFNGNNIGSPVAGTGNKISFGYYTAEGDYTAEAISHHGCKAMMQGAVQVKKIQLPKEFSMLGGGQFYNEPGDGTYCDGDIGVGIGLSGSEQNFEYILKLNGTKVISTRIGTGTDFSFGYFTEEGTYTVSAQLIGGGCTNNMKGSITVRKIPAPQKYTLTTSGKYCEGEAGVDILLNGSQPGVLYQLQFNGENIGNLINGTGSSINFGVFKDPGIYTAIATSTNMGCATQMNGEVSPEMIPKPVAYDIAGIDYFCKGSEGPEITLSNSEVGVMYQLMLDGRPIGNPISGTGSSISFGKQNIVGLYTIGATRIEGNCTNEMNGSINLREIPSPEISITGNMTPKFGGNENYTDESAGEGDQYVWTVLGGKINGSNTSASINVNWGNNKKGKVRVTKTNSYGCTSTSEVDINLINNIVADFEVDKIKGEVPLTVNFTDKSEGYITFREWDFGDGYSSPLVNPGHVYKIPGKYTVKLTVGYGDVFIDKIKTDLITAENVLSVDESSANLISKNGISISAIEPNPSSDVIRFTYGVNTPQNISIAIYNIYGERVMAISDGYISEGTYNKEMDISNLPSGAYYLQILGKDGQVNQMISVVR